MALYNVCKNIQVFWQKELVVVFYNFVAMQLISCVGVFISQISSTRCLYSKQCMACVRKVWPWEIVTSPSMLHECCMPRKGDSFNSLSSQAKYRVCQTIMRYDLTKQSDQRIRRKPKRLDCICLVGCESNRNVKSIMVWSDIMEDQ